MKPARHMTDNELDYSASDLRTAIAVTHPGHFSNMDRYLADYREVVSEQEARARKRIFRQNILDMPGDLLLVQTVTRRDGSVRACLEEDSRYHRVQTLHTAKRINTGQEVRRKRGQSAMFNLYWKVSA